MNNRVYAIRDNKMGTFGRPVLIENDEVAKRQFGDIITSGDDSVMTKHPSDFTLYWIGEYNSKTAKFTSATCPEALATGSDFATPKKD